MLCKYGISIMPLSIDNISQIEKIPNKYSNFVVQFF